MLSNSAFDYFASLYRPEYCSQMIKFCAGGRSPEAFAAQIDSTPEVFAFWARNHIEFEISLHIAFWKSYSWWEKESMENPKLSGAVYNAVMKNRFKWKDGAEDIQKIVRNLDTAELEQLARRLLTEQTDAIQAEPEDDDE